MPLDVLFCVFVFSSEFRRHFFYLDFPDNLQRKIDEFKIVFYDVTENDTMQVYCNASNKHGQLIEGARLSVTGKFNISVYSCLSKCTGAGRVVGRMTLNTCIQFGDPTEREIIPKKKQVCVGSHPSEVALDGNGKSCSLLPSESPVTNEIKQLMDKVIFFLESFNMMSVCVFTQLRRPLPEGTYNPNFVLL